MKNALYVCQVEFRDESDGVAKKVKGQIQAFNDLKVNMSCFAYYEGKTSISKCESLKKMKFECINGYCGRFRRFVFWKELLKEIQINHYDFIYIRNSFIDFGVLKNLKMMKKKKCKVIMEIPSLTQEISLRNKVVLMQFLVDRLLNKRIKRYVDKLLYVGEVETALYGMTAEPIPNGIPYGADTIKQSGFHFENETINVLAVSTMGKSRGYERLLTGLSRYYCSKNFKYRINVTFVGEGESVNELKEITQRENLGDYVVFKPRLRGKALDDEFDKATIGVGALGLYKLRVECASTLKVKEYLIRGLPFIYAGKEISLPGNFEYAIQFDNDNSPIDFDRVVGFVEEYSKKAREDIVFKMRDFALSNYTWKNILQNVCKDIVE